LEKNLKFTDLKWLKKRTYIFHHGWKKFEIYSSQLWLKNTHKSSTIVGENLEFSDLKWLKIHLNCPPWLEKILKYSHLNWLKKMHLLSTMVGENFEIF
jgi:hypothetical protein